MCCHRQFRCSLLEFGVEFVILIFQNFEENLIVRNMEEMALAERGLFCLQ